jgi:hypothetical protein
MATAGMFARNATCGFWWEQEVDSTRFVKLFLDGIKQAAGLSKPGIQVFERGEYAAHASLRSTQSAARQ